jgi:ribosome biogenesis protein Nip4
MRNDSDKTCGEIKHFMFHIFFPENRAVYEIMWRTIEELDRPQTTIYGACTLHAGYRRLQTHTQNVKYLLLFDGKNVYANAPQYIASLG